MVSELRCREVGFKSLHENLDVTTPGDWLVLHAFAAPATRSAARPLSSSPNLIRACECCPTPSTAGP